MLIFVPNFSDLAYVGVWEYRLEMGIYRRLSV